MDEASAKKLLHELVSSTIPEYIIEGSQYLLDSGGVQKISVKKGDGYWDISGTVQGEDFQIYSPKISLDFHENSTNFICNCPEAFSGACRHVGAAALKFIPSLEEGATTEAAPAKPRSDWRQNFRSYFSTELEPEAGRHYLLYRFHPEPGRLQVSFFRARQNKSGLSTVHNEITIQQLLDHPDWHEQTPGLAELLEQVGKYNDYFGHRVEIPDGLLTWFLWTVKNEYYLFWQDTDKPCRIETTTMQLKLKPDLEEAGLTFAVMIEGSGKQPLSITEEDVSFHGQMPLWVCWKKGFHPVHTTLDAMLVQDLVQHPPHVSRDDIPEFLDRVWTQFPTSDLHEPEKFLEHMEPIFVPGTYNPKLFLDEEGSLLTLEIQNFYETIHGEFLLPGPNPEFMTGSYSFEGTTYLIRRMQGEEAFLAEKLLEMNFQPRNNRIWFLEPEEAITFLLDAYPKLIEQYRVFGEKALSKYKVRLATPVINATVESNEDEKWFSLDIEVDYDGQKVPIDLIWKAWSQGKRYVQLKDGSYTSLPESWLEKVAHKLRAMGLDPEKPPQQRFEQYEAPVLDNLLDDLPEVETDGFWDTLREKIHTFKEVTSIDPPAGLQATLRGYQQQGLSYLNFLREYGFGGILADEMGLGKTIQTLSFIQHMVERGDNGPNLIVVPTSVLPNWDREAAKFVPELKRLIIYGTRRENMFKQINNANLVVTTYALLRRDLEELQKYEFNSIILDEAQNIKNPNTITARSVRKINAQQRLCLSGTPIENNLFELWSLFEFLMPGFLGSQHAFQRGIVKPIKDGDVETIEQLRTRVKPFILRRTKAEVAKDLPPKIENVQYCALAEEQAELYHALASKLREQVMSDVDERGMARSQMSILDALLKLRQICCHPRLLNLNMPGFTTNLPSGKFEAFKDMISDIVSEGHKVLVFSQFVSMLHIIRSWLQIADIPYAYLDGTSKDRFDQVDRFNDSPDIPIFLISLKAGGTGLNLTSADYVIHYDPWWNPAVENQATDRAHRIGQKSQVFSYKMICSDTVEEKILKLQEMKKGVADSIIPGKEAWKSLTRDDLEMLFDI